MQQRDIDRAVARATGETVTTISQLGFSLVNPDDDPQVVDWETLDANRPGLFPRRKPRRRVCPLRRR